MITKDRTASGEDNIEKLAGDVQRLEESIDQKKSQIAELKALNATLESEYVPLSELVSKKEKDLNDLRVRDANATSDLAKESARVHALIDKLDSDRLEFQVFVTRQEKELNDRKSVLDARATELDRKEDEQKRYFEKQSQLMELAMEQVEQLKQRILKKLNGE